MDTRTENYRILKLVGFVHWKLWNFEIRWLRALKIIKFWNWMDTCTENCEILKLDGYVHWKL